MAMEVKHLVLAVVFLSLSAFSSCQGKESWEEQYPFIRLASSFSSRPSSSSSSSSSVGSSGGGKTYDYIVVGGGTAGCPLAATLSRNFSVLLLERGGVPFNNQNVSNLKNFHISLADNSPKSAAQIILSTDGVFNVRARILGGATCVNAGFYTRASQRYIKKARWDAKLVNESYPWIEKQIIQWPDLVPWQRTVRDSLVEIGVSPFNGYTYDHIYGTKVGGTIFEENGFRHTAAELLSSANPKNLNVLIHATVQNIVFDTKGRKPKATGVIFKDEHGNQHEAYLSKRKGSEIILSSGAIGSPQLLLLSGIGPKAHLRKMNITVVLDNKFVGEGMADNPMNAVFVPTKGIVKQSLIQTVGITKKGVYIEASSGFGESPNSIVNCHHGIMSSEIGQLSTVPPKLRTKELMEKYIKEKAKQPYEVFKGGFILEKIARPISTGKLFLINKNVDDNPSVTFNYFSHPRDLRRCVDGIRIMEKVVMSKHFKSFGECDQMTIDKLLNLSVQANVNLIPKHLNDTKSVEQFCKDTVITIWHYHGGCHVGKVVNADYRVLGVHRLRVVDGSIFTESPGTNPQATVMMMGRYMGLKILRERLGKGAGL